MLASLHELKKQNTVQAGRSFGKIFEVSINILFQKVYLGWKFSPLINRRGVGIRMSWVKKIKKLNSGGDIY